MCKNTRKIKLPQTGTCHLCLTENITLENSHLIPKWAYKSLLDRGNPDDKAPIIAENGSAIFSNDQSSHYLLCKKCEQSFSTKEDYIRRIVATGQKPLVRDIAPLSDYDKKGTLIQLPNNTKIEFLAYFALSIIWRYSLKHADTSVHLGNYQDQIRQYLLSGIMPDKLSQRLNVILFIIDSREIPDLSKTIVPPQSIKKTGYHFHHFSIIDFRFNVTLGNSNIPIGLKSACLLKGTDKNCFLISWDNDTTNEQAFRVSKTAETKGKLNKMDR